MSRVTPFSVAGSSNIEKYAPKKDFHENPDLVAYAKVKQQPLRPKGVFLRPIA